MVPLENTDIEVRKPKTYRLKPSIIDMVKEISKRTGEEKADVVENAISYYYVNVLPKLA